MLKKFFCAVLALVGLAGCGSVSVQDYANEKPALDLKQYFSGTLDGWGIFQDRSGKVIKRFHVVIEAKWVGEVGTLDEKFNWADGTTSRRVWTITRTGPNKYVGRADDVVGEAEGLAAGNALRWKYVLALPMDGKTYHVDFDDWMYQMDDKVMLNRSLMSKFGVSLGELTLSFTKR